MASDINDDLELANAHWDLAAYFDKKAVRDSSYYHYFQSHTLFKNIGDSKNAGQLLLNMAIQQSKARAYVESEKTTFEAIELLESHSDTILLFHCYNNLGTVTKELEEFDRSLEFFEKAAEYVEMMKEPEKGKNERSLDNNLGNVYKEQENWAQSIPYFEAALEFENLEQERPRAYAQTLSNLTYSRVQNGDTLNAFSNFNKALKIQLTEDDKQGASLGYYYLAKYHGQMGYKQKALFYALKAIALAEESSNIKRKLETLKLMSFIAPENDLYFDEYVMLNERLQKEERQIRDKFARIEYETDKALSKAEILAREQQIIIVIALGLIMLVLSALIIIYQRIRAQRLRFQQQQQESNQEIFNLMLSQKQKMQEGKNSEQKRISEELHDGVLGAMNGIRMVLLGLNKKTDDSAVNMRGEALEKLKEVQEEIRSISHELNHASYRKFHNFINSINDLLKETMTASDLEIAFNYNEDLEWDSLSGDTKINLYRIIQESLQNIIKHANASKVDLDFERLEDLLKIRISDNGKGFDVRKAKKGIGQKNIRSRVQKLNGTWNVESAPGEGTTISVLLPYLTDQQETSLLVNEAGQLEEVKKD
ncbi:MAG: sensor histidine kinase [Eudoraea sp.]|nr:sensor histidine kinase [Eudoraea sp.]